VSICGSSRREACWVQPPSSPLLQRLSMITTMREASCWSCTWHTLCTEHHVISHAVCEVLFISRLREKSTPASFSSKDFQCGHWSCNALPFIPAVLCSLHGTLQKYPDWTQSTVACMAFALFEHSIRSLYLPCNDMHFFSSWQSKDLRLRSVTNQASGVYTTLRLLGATSFFLFAHIFRYLSHLQ
jgi:hypothetical protein